MLPRRPYVSNRPLLDTDADAELFVGRAGELDRLRRALDLGLNVLLAGAPGVGKTSLLRQLAWRARVITATYGIDARYVPASNAESVGDLLGLVGTTLGVPEVRSRGDDPFDQLALLAKVLSARPATPRVVALLDEPPTGAALGLFARLRDDVWQVPLTWVVAVEPTAGAALMRPPSDAFFEVAFDLGPLPAPDLRAMLDRRLPPDALPTAALDQLAADGRPRHVLDTARRLLTGTSWAELSHARQERANVLTRLGRPARMAVDALEEVGGAASASDQELLDRLGWTRARAVQVLGALEAAGVLTSDTVPTGRLGRPRKVYRLLAPAISAGAA